MSERPLKELRTWALIVLLTGIPIFLAWLVIDRDCQNQEQERTARTFEYLETFARSHRRGHDCSSEISYFFQNVVEESNGAPDPIAFFRERFYEVKKRFPGYFEALVLKRDGTLAGGFDAFPELLPTIEAFGRDYVQFRSGSPKALNRNFITYYPLFGPFIIGSLEYATLSGTYLRSFSEHRTFLWHPGIRYSERELYFPLVFISARDGYQLLGLRLMRMLLKRRMPSAFASIVDLERSPAKWKTPQGISAAQLRRELLERRGNDQRPWYSQGCCWVQFPYDQRFRLVLALPAYEINEVRETRERASEKMILILIALAIGIRAWLLVSPGMSLRRQLLLLFLYTTAIPLLLLGYTAGGLLNNRAENLRRQAWEENVRVLEEHDRLGIDIFTYIENLGGTLARLPPLAADAERAWVASAVERLAAQMGVAYAFISDSLGRQVYQFITGRTNRSGQSFDGLAKALSPVFAAQCARRIADFNGKTMPPLESAREQALKATIESFGIDLEHFICFMEDYVGRAYTLFLAGQKSFVYGVYCRASDTAEAKYAALFLWSEGMLVELLAKVRERFHQRCPELLLAGEADGFRSADRSGRAPITDFYSARLYEERIPLHDRVTVGTQTYLISGILSDRFYDRSLLVARPETPVLAETGSTARQLGLVAAILLLLGTLVGILLSRNLLRPIGHLGRGIEAVRTRNFRVRLPVESHDELGRLNETFNRMMEGLADLEVARVVHETFFPQQSLSAGDWDICGICRTAGKVGGDYFDYFALPDGRWLLLIGDVSGHGTAAALIVAMAKAIVCHPDTPPEPAVILAHLNRQLVQTTRRRRLMSCLVGIFDPASGLLLLSNAGHCFPYRVSNSQASEMRLTHPLLGVKNSLPFPCIERRIDTGDAVCFYSDGLVETRTADGSQIGYGALQSALPGLRRSTARESCESILTWRSELALTDVLEDDVTVVMLQKSARAA